MSKRILILNGSPRLKGNTAMLCDAFTEGAVSAGHSVTRFDLQKLDIHGCLGCVKGGKDPASPCVQKDGMTAIYPAYRDADLIVLAVKPWLTEQLVREIRRTVDPDRQSIVSVAAGVTLAQLAEWLSEERAMHPALFRAIPNTAIAVQQSMTFVATQCSDKGRIDEVLESVGMSDKKEKMPYELSGGEQQRIAIARAILNKPKMIIADEPTGNLDPETADNIVSLLKQISLTGTAVVMSTHNLPMLDKYPGVVYQCKDGHLNDVTSEYNKISLTGDE